MKNARLLGFVCFKCRYACGPYTRAMQVVKITVGVFVAVLVALLTHDAIREYRQLGPHRLAVDIAPDRQAVPSEISVPRQPNIERMQRQSAGLQPAGTIEWTDKPETRRIVP